MERLRRRRGEEYPIITISNYTNQAEWRSFHEILEDVSRNRKLQRINSSIYTDLEPAYREERDLKTRSTSDFIHPLRAQSGISYTYLKKRVQKNEH